MFFYLYSRSIRCVYRKLILEFVDDESDLHHVCVMVGYNILNLYLVGNDIACFMSICCEHIVDFLGFD